MTDLQNINKDFVKDTIDSFTNKEFFGSTREEKNLIDCMKRNDFKTKDVKIMQKNLNKSMMKSKESLIASVKGSHNGMTKHFIVERMRQKLADKKGLKIN